MKSEKQIEDENRFKELVDLFIKLDEIEFTWWLKTSNQLNSPSASQQKPKQQLAKSA